MRIYSISEGPKYTIIQTHICKLKINAILRFVQMSDLYTTDMVNWLRSV